jgi:hypothetical protein
MERYVDITANFLAIVHVSGLHIHTQCIKLTCTATEQFGNMVHDGRAVITKSIASINNIPPMTDY